MQYRDGVLGGQSGAGERDRLQVSGGGFDGVEETGVKLTGLDLSDECVLRVDSRGRGRERVESRYGVAERDTVQRVDGEDALGVCRGVGPSEQEVREVDDVVPRPRPEVFRVLR